MEANQDDDETENCLVVNIADVKDTRGMESKKKEAEVFIADVSKANGVKLYKRRWVMLFLFCAYSTVNAYQWIHLNIIANIVMRYYNESLPEDRYHREMTIDWLANFYMATYLPLIIPGMWMLIKYGLKINIILGAVLNCVGAWIKCIGLAPDRFYLVMTGQIFCAIANVFVVSFPPLLSATWFGPNEVSTATALGVFGNQVGVAVGFLLPPVMVPNSSDMDAVGSDLAVTFYICAAFSTAILLLIAVFYENEPPLPPSQAQLKLKETTISYSYSHSLLTLFKQPSFVLLAVSYGLITGIYYAISTLLNFIILDYFQGQEVNAGRIGLVIVFAGIVASVVAGVWLDKTKTYKATSVFIYVLSTLGMLALTFTMDQGQIWIVFLTAGTLGFFMTGYLPVGYEFAAEITYPEPEGTSAGILTGSAMLFGMILTLCLRDLMLRVGVMGSNIAVSVVLAVGAVMTMCVKGNYLRQRAEITTLKEHIIGEDKLEPNEEETSSILNEKH